MAAEKADGARTAAAAALFNGLFEMRQVAIGKPVERTATIIACNQFEIRHCNNGRIAGVTEPSSNPPISEPRVLSERKFSTASDSRRSINSRGRRTATGFCATSRYKRQPRKKADRYAQHARSSQAWDSSRILILLVFSVF